LKERVLGFLTENLGEYVSGGAICLKLGCTRAAVWKYIRALRSDGAAIEASTRRGYRLTSLPDFLSEHAVRREMRHNEFWDRLIALETVGSTNDYIKSLPFAGATAVIASEQTCGRGRMGRAWHSPRGGMYMSMLLRPRQGVSELGFLSMLFPVAVREALLDTTGLDCGIKWPNDIVFQNRKLAGILTESVCEFGGECVCAAGVGINVRGAAFPHEEFAPYGASVSEFCGDAVNINTLAAAVLDKTALLTDKPHEYIHGQYMLNCVTLGRNIKAWRGGELLDATAKEIAPDGALIAALPDGGEERLVSGEVSVRGVMDYV